MDCSNQIGELLVGAGVWDGNTLNIVSIGSVDLCPFGGPQLAGYVAGNDVIVRVYKTAEGVEYDSELTWNVGSGTFGDGYQNVSQITLVELGICEDDNDATAAFGGCAGAVAALGCDFLFAGIAFSTYCPVTCDSCPEIEGCNDPEACNYDETANIDDGSCIYPDDHYDCDGNCLVELDCAGNCCVIGDEGCYWQETGPCGEEGPNNGTDSCGVCGGDNSSCADCAGVPCSDAYVDNCGVCDDDPSNDCGYECGSWGGDAFLDECGACYGGGIPANNSIRANAEYVASTGFGLGNYEAVYQGIEGFVIANTCQLNLEYQAGVDSDAVDAFNNLGGGTYNWMDPEFYVVTISESGGLPAWSYSELEEDEMDADLQWTITGWGQTILGGTIEEGRLVVTTDYRPFDADIIVNDVEVFEGNILMEVIAYTFDGAASDIGYGTQLGVELRVDSCDCDGNYADCAGVCGGDLELDCAGVCGGDNSTALSCCGLPFYDDCTTDCYEDSIGTCCIEEDVDECGMCFGDNACLACEAPFIDIDGFCLHGDDISFLQDMIDNSLTSGYNEQCEPNDPYCSSPNFYMDMSDSWFNSEIDGQYYQFANDNGIVEPLELGLQKWEDGRIIEIMCGAYIYCNLSGELPSTVSNLTEVEVLRLEVNYFTGYIPESICEFENLNYSDNLSFDLSHNMLCPPYPECVPEGAVQYMNTDECEPECDLGDVNCDNQINVIDIVMTVGLILENSYDAIGDVNEDGQLNVIDVVMLVNWVLNGTGCSDGSAWDYDMDGICDTDDADDDNDGALDPADSDDNNEYVCSDIDGDNCDDCSSGTFDPANDGIDMNGNGICDEGEANNDTDGDGVIDDEDSDPFNPYQCSDNDGDTCDDCSTGTFNLSDDGYDYDGDGQCDDGDCDDDNDGCQECWDYCP